MIKGLIKKLMIPLTAFAIGTGILVGCASDEEKGKPKSAIEQEVSEFMKSDRYNSNKFNEIDLMHLAKNEVPLDSAVAYDERFFWKDHGTGPAQDVYHLERLWSEGITPSLANQYNERFGPSDIFDFHKRNISPEIANAYDERFEGWIIRSLAMSEESQPEIVNAYNQRFKRLSVERFLKDGVTPEEANGYDEGFSSGEIIQLVKNNISPRIAEGYVDNFNSANIVEFYKNGVSANLANRYTYLNNRFGTHISPEDIIFFSKEGIPFEEIERKAKEAAIREKIIN